MAQNRALGLSQVDSFWIISTKLHMNEPLLWSVNISRQIAIKFLSGHSSTSH